MISSILTRSRKSGSARPLMMATEDRSPASRVFNARRLSAGMEAAPGFWWIGASVPSKSRDRRTWGALRIDEAISGRWSNNGCVISSSWLAFDSFRQLDAYLRNCGNQVGRPAINVVLFHHSPHPAHPLRSFARIHRDCKVYRVRQLLDVVRIHDQGILQLTAG